VVLYSIVSKEAISIEMSTIVLLMTFIGGIGHFFGPVLGAAFYTYLQNYLSELTDSWPLFLGLLFIAMVLWMPGGIAGGLHSCGRWIMKRFGAKYSSKGED
jgi:branched-chain amino acid transport system permease protein